MLDFDPCRSQRGEAGVRLCLLTRADRSVARPVSEKCIWMSFRVQHFVWQAFQARALSQPLISALEPRTIMASTLTRPSSKAQATSTQQQTAAVTSTAVDIDELDLATFVRRQLPESLATGPTFPRQRPTRVSSRCCQLRQRATTDAAALTSATPGTASAPRCTPSRPRPPTSGRSGRPALGPPSSTSSSGTSTGFSRRYRSSLSPVPCPQQPVDLGRECARGRLPQSVAARLPGQRSQRCSNAQEDLGRAWKVFAALEGLHGHRF